MRHSAGLKWVTRLAVTGSPGSGSPFDKIAQADAKILMYDVPFNTMTFEHYLEDRFQETLPAELFEPKSILVMCVDKNGYQYEVPTKVLSVDINSRRRTDRLEKKLSKSNIIRSLFLRTVHLQVLSCRSAIRQMASKELSCL